MDFQPTISHFELPHTVRSNFSDIQIVAITADGNVVRVGKLLHTNTYALALAIQSHTVNMCTQRACVTTNPVRWSPGVDYLSCVRIHSESLHRDWLTLGK